jgi:hypothetical protein
VHLEESGNVKDVGDHTLGVEHSANGARDTGCRATYMKFEVIGRDQGHEG